MIYIPLHCANCGVSCTTIVPIEDFIDRRIQIMIHRYIESLGRQIDESGFWVCKGCIGEAFFGSN